MSLFGTSSSLNPDIEKATNENNTTEKWGLIMDICDKVNSGTATPKECLKSIIKRLNHANPHVVMKAITLLDACVNNCGKQFHLEVASREFETEFKKLLQKSQPKVTTKLKLSLKRWAEEAFKSDPQLDLIPSLYKKLREEGHDFNDPSATPKRETPLSKDPNVVSSQQEEDDIAKAIELSLKEAKLSQSPKMLSTAASGPSITSLYPSTLLSAAPVPEPRKVRALYDFEAAEDNELTFQAGEIIMVLDDSDPNWWKGQNQRGEGLFPSNFVTADLSVEPESLGATGQGKGSKKSVQFSDDPKEDGTGSGNEKDAQLQKLPVVEINEEKINRLLHLIHEADPQDPSQDTEEMLQLEQLVNQMGPLIDAELERVDRKHAQLTQLSSDLVDAINLYHNLMREPDRSMMMSMGGGPAGGAYGMTGGPGGLGAYPGAPMPPPMYGMPGMYAPPNLPGAGMYPMGPGHQQQQQPPMSGYSMGQLRHDMGQMNVAPGMPQFPAPPQQSSLPHLPHHHPVSSVSQNGPTNSGMAPVATSMAPGVSSQPTTQPAPTPQSMPNMTVPQMTPQSLPPPGSHMQQAAIPQGYANPTSPPPTGMSGPGVPPTQLRPSGPLSYHQNYGPQPSPQQQQQPQPQPVPQSGPPPQQQPQHVVPVTGSGMGVALTATTQPANMNHHPHLALNGVASGGSGPAMGHYPPAPSTSGPGSMPPSQMPPHHHQQHLHQQQPQQTFIMPPMGGPPQPMGGYPMGPMVGGMFPSGPVVTSGGGPLSINTNPGPQNIPIYQQQR